MRMSKGLLASLVLLSAIAWSGSARADYVCWVTHLPASYSSAIGYGNEGVVSVSLYTSPGCTGTYRGQFLLCSPGAGGTACATAANCGGVDYLYTASELNALSQNLQRAADTGQKVGRSTCNATVTSAIYFYSN